MDKVFTADERKAYQLEQKKLQYDEFRCVYPWLSTDKDVDEFKLHYARLSAKVIQWQRKYDIKYKRLDL